ncbi:hypothetical protein TSUD_410110 [Trifolium subterraneum]|uniref:Aminotransferase-like plant mobile domain-containing protein n=1 Tax=Trifolium subterraneum TaxID=3900 RepID=A0A2Z6P2A3_TRISU|nr:hypothetical protein TSUD_410110 [Trifolium subterraneum]
MWRGQTNLSWRVENLNPARSVRWVMGLSGGPDPFYHPVVRTRGRDGRIRHAGVGRGVSMPVEQEQDIEQPVIVEQPMMQEDEDVAQHGWPGGPLDTSLLTRYSDHVARYIWFGKEHIEGAKPELRIASLGSKLTGWVPGPGQHHPNIQGWLDESGLKWLEQTSLSKVDPQILSAFTERWHPETSSFHMPFGEMTITLDDVVCLLHIPVRGYLTLLQCWIHEYFPTLGRRGESVHRCDEMGYPRAMRWVYKQGKTKLPAYRPIMNALTPSDVIWRPFEGHRGSIPSDLITCFSGYLRGCTLTHPVRFDAETTADYLSWYYAVSHPILCRPHDGPHGGPPVP